MNQIRIKSTIILLIMLFIIIVPAIFADLPRSFDPSKGNTRKFALPVAEYQCFNEFADKSANFSFTLETPDHPVNITKIREENPDSIKIVIHRFDEMCDYTTNPRECYNCITLQRYGLWESRKNSTNNIDSTNETNIRSLYKTKTKFIITSIIIIVVLACILVYQLMANKKKSKKAKLVKYKE